MGKKENKLEISIRCDDMCKKHCIYCGTTENLSVSDIIPDALTNARITNDCVCQDLHNSKMTEKFESIVAKKLSFLTNELDIKSSKSKSYPDYSAIIEIEGSNDDFITKNKVLWNKEHTQAIGDIETIKAIAKSYQIDESKVKIVDINNIEIIKTIKFDTGVFFSLEMYRQVAKIAFEWYCAQNKVTEKHECFNEIIKYIVEGVGENIVSIVADKDINNKFNNYCNNGSHCLVGYKTKEGEINVFVDMFGLIIYNVKICDDIPEFCDKNCLLQKLNLDATRNNLCLNDYNDLVEDMLNSCTGVDDTLPKVSFNGLSICVATKSKDVSGNLFYMDLLNNLCNGFLKEDSYTEEIIDRLINNTQKLLQGSLVHKRALKRFISEKIDFKSDIVLNPNGNDKKGIFIYYLLFVLGKENPDEMNEEVLEKIICKKFGNKEIIITEKLHEEMKNLILEEVNYSSIIMAGARKVLEWK